MDYDRTVVPRKAAGAPSTKHQESNIMSNDNKLPIHASLCSSCVESEGKKVTMLTGYCLTSSRCNRCEKTEDLAMVRIDTALTNDSRTGTQNRPYTAEVLMVRATLTVRGIPSTWEFNWNDRESVRRFAADSDRCIRAGGHTTLERVE